MSFMIRGLGKKRGSKLSALEPLALVDITFHYREKYDVQTVKEIHVKSAEGSLFYDPVKGSITLFLAEMLYKSLREESPDEELFNYVSSALHYFKSITSHTLFHLLFLTKLTRFLGFFPKGEHLSSTPYFDLQNGIFTGNRNNSLHTLDRDESAAVASIIKSEYDTEIKIATSARREILKALVEYYRLHLEGFGEVKSLPVLMEVFSD